MEYRTLIQYYLQLHRYGASASRAKELLRQKAATLGRPDLVKVVIEGAEV